MFVSVTLLAPTPVDGQWSAWSAWSTCTEINVPCYGIKSRSRTCTSPAPAFSGKDCRGFASMDVLCALSCSCK